MELDTPLARQIRWTPTKIIQALDLALEQNFQPGAYVWIDQNHNNAWSKSTDEFDLCLGRYQKACLNFEPGMDQYMWEQTQKYIQTVSYYFSLYRKYKNISEEQSIINSVNAASQQFDLNFNQENL